MRRVAVTGLGVISPLGNDVQTFWDNIKAGKNGISGITKFDCTDYRVKVAAEVHDFEPKDYMEKLDVLHSDVYTHFAIGAASQAVEDSGIIGTVEKDRIGVMIGSGIGGIETFMKEHKKLIEKGPKRVSPFFIPMMIPNMASSMIAIRYGCMGPGMPQVTACASGSNAIGEAMRLIRHGYVDAMIAGGSEATVNPLAAAGFQTMMALSFSEDPNEASLPFDARRGGFVMGEGAGCLILEEYEHAKARGAHIYAELCGYGSTNDAYHMTSPEPEAEGAYKAILQAWEELGIDTDNVYYNAHGTGTVMNDKIETLAIKRALGEERARKIDISSTKSMTGHMLGAAGAVEAIVCVKALTDGIAPPTINYKEPDPDCDLNYTPNKAKEGNYEVALSSSLGFGGHNACLAFKRNGGEA